MSELSGGHSDASNRGTQVDKMGQLGVTYGQKPSKGVVV